MSLIMYHRGTVRIDRNCVESVDSSEKIITEVSKVFPEAAFTLFKLGAVLRAPEDIKLVKEIVKQAMVEKCALDPGTESGCFTLKINRVLTRKAILAALGKEQLSSIYFATNDDFVSIVMVLQKSHNTSNGKIVRPEFEVHWKSHVKQDFLIEGSMRWLALNLLQAGYEPHRVPKLCSAYSAHGAGFPIDKVDLKQHIPI